MSINDYLEKMKAIQNHLLEFLENETDKEENFKKFTEILLNKYEFKSFLHLLVNISNNHHRGPNFFNCIDQILLFFKDDIIKYYSNYEIFTIFKKNKRILLFLIENEIMKMDANIIKKIISDQKLMEWNYLEYFAPEVRPFADFISENIKNSQYSPKDELPTDFDQNRKKGENEKYICQLIREDNVIDFIVYINKNNLSLKSQIKTSIYETNSFLMSEIEISLIEYAAFYGSNQIFKYLEQNGIDLNQQLCIYAIHGQNAEFIHQLEEKFNFNEDEIGEKCFHRAVKCHHNDFANYFMDHYLNKFDFQSSKHTILSSFNFAFIQNDISDSCFSDLCVYDYYMLVNFLFKKYENSISVHDALFYAIENENIEIVEFLIEKYNMKDKNI